DSGDARDPEPRASEAAATPAMPTPAGAGEATPSPAPETPSDPAAIRAHLEALDPATTRAGHLRFTDPLLRDAQATEVFAARLAVEATPAEERQALAEALHRTGGAWSAAILTQLEREADPEVRVILVGTLAKAPTADALAGLRLGLGDADSRVRRAACELAGWAPEAGAVEAERLVAALGDDEAMIRAAAARSLGLLGDAGRFAAVAPGLEDSDAEVRLQSLRALERLDRSRAAGLPEVAKLAESGGDPRVKRAAGKLRAEASP
ncbi:MAG: HEAT repeat domain-containing protein, partial [Myxococcales bacterium]|nr:HEAT repeat domain-containing protein [Myxococcales bacterium]